jgi:ketosteroid isomerase-like protein
MAIPNDLNAFLETLYSALADGNIARWIDLHSDDIIFNVNGGTPVSGRWQGKQTIVQELLPQLFTLLDAEQSRIGHPWRLMCADGNRAVVIFEGNCTTKQGQAYDNRYLQILEFDANQNICEVWEFFDTDLAMRVLFDNTAQTVRHTQFKY